MTFEQKKNIKALSWTAGAHLLLLLFFLLFRYTMPAQQPVEELGMEVNLGTMEDGYGFDQPELAEDPAAAEAVVTTLPSAASDHPDREIHTSDDAAAPAVISRQRTDNRRRTAAPPVQRTPDRVANSRTASSTRNQQATTQDPKYVFQGATGTGGNSAQASRAGGSEGIGQGEGDMGVPGGTPGAENYTGTPGGGGSTIGHTIANRQIVQRPDPSATFREGGNVVIRVTVNREGSIIQHRVVSAANTTIRNLALQKIKSVKFNASPSAPAEQFGNITFRFSTTRK